MLQRGDPGPTGSTFTGVLLVAVLGVLLWQEAPLESARPSGPETGWSAWKAKEVPARLWQDPFKAVHMEQENGDISPSHLQPSEIQREIAKATEEGKLILLPVMLSAGPYAELVERRRRRRYAVLSAVGESGFVPRDPNALNVFSNPRSDLFPRENLLPRERFPSRRVWVVNQQAKRPQGSQEGPSGPRRVIPYEWYDWEDPKTGKKGNRSVVVLWLHESHFAKRPFKKLTVMLNRLLGDPEKINRSRIETVVLGPARSNTLRTMASRAQHWGSEPADPSSAEYGPLQWLRQKSGLAGFSILSPTATISAHDLCQALAPNGESQPAEKPKRCDESKNDKKTESPEEGPILGKPFKLPQACENSKDCLGFLRTILSDDRLIEQLVKEIKKRKAPLQEDKISEIPSERKPTTVVISEWDTHFGRSLPRAFAREYCGNPAGCEALLRYTYQRGIDGITISQTDRSSSNESSGAAKKRELSTFPPTGAIRRPSETGQFDYLRRLAKHLRAKDRDLRQKGEKGIQAVAILGSDVFDKLLILRAIRDQLPGTLWLTTDLDAHLLHPGEFSWARNLVIASTYGLRLPDSVQESTLPFRGAYQASMFLATRLAVGQAKECNKENGGKCFFFESSANGALPLGQRLPERSQLKSLMKPRLFEVGRNGPVALSSAESPPSQSTLLGLLLIGLLALAALRLIYPYSSNLSLSVPPHSPPRAGTVLTASAYFTWVLSVLILFWGVLTLVAWQSKEPLSFTAGVSLWPTEYIRLAAFVLAWFLVAVGINRLRKNWEELNQEYFQGQSAPEPQNERKWVVLNLVLTLLVVLAFFQELIMKGILAVEAEQLAKSLGVGWLLSGRSEQLLLKAVIWGLLISFWLLAITGKLGGLSTRVRSLNKWLESQPPEPQAWQLWQEYGERGSLKDRFLRATTYTLFYLTFAFLIVTMLEGPAIPYRGEYNWYADRIVVVLSVLSMHFLLFLVADAVRLCTFWIQKLRAVWIQKLQKDCPREWRQSWNSNLSKELPEKHFWVWMAVHLIGQRTAEVTRLLYYPVLVILLLLLARIAYFDDWGFPKALVVIVGGSFVIVLASAIYLNYVARTVRSEMLSKLRWEELQLTAISNDEGHPQPTRDEVRSLIDQLEGLQVGAYQPFWERPTVRATLLLISGIAITVFKYLPTFP